MYMMGTVSAYGPRDVEKHRASGPGAPAGNAGEGLTARATFSNPVVMLRLRDRHRGWSPPGKVGGLDHRPLGLLWAESAETLTWAEMDSLLSAREQHFRSLLWATSGLEKSEPGRNNLGGGRANKEMVPDDGAVWLAWSRLYTGQCQSPISEGVVVDEVGALLSVG